MKTLTVKVAFPPERLAEICREHGNTCGDLRFGVRVCPFAGASCPIDNIDKTCGDTTAEDWEKVLQEPEEKKTDSWKVGDIVEIKNARDGKWYPGKILLIDKTSAPFFVQSEFGFKEVSKLTRCLWCSEDQLRRLEEPEPEPEFKFGDRVTVTDLTSFHGIFNAYTEHGKAYILKEGEYACSAEFVSNLKAGWE